MEKEGGQKFNKKLEMSLMYRPLVNSINDVGFKEEGSLKLK